MRISKSQKAVFAIALVMLLGTMACVRTLSGDSPVDEKGLATDSAAETKDAAVQMTLAALLGTATNQVQEEQASNTPEATEASPSETAAATSEASPTASLEATVEATSDGTAVATATATATASESSLCYVHRYVYDESYPDGTRVDPGEKIEKIWRLQNVGTCDWVNGKYRMVFVSGEKMGGTSPVLIEFTVRADEYANFSINLTAPSTPGTYRGYWILKTTDGDAIGWGPDGDEAFWVEIQVRGDTPTP